MPSRTKDRSILPLALGELAPVEIQARKPGVAAGGWELAKVTVPPGSWIRARGYVIAHSASWFVENIFGAPLLVTQPVSRGQAVGTTTTFTALAAGSGPFGYQWYYNDAALPGGTNSSLTLLNITPAMQGGYFVVITNDYGSVTSSVAVLTVVVLGTPPPDPLGYVIQYDQTQSGRGQGTIVCDAQYCHFSSGAPAEPYLYEVVGSHSFKITNFDPANPGTAWSHLLFTFTNVDSGFTYDLDQASLQIGSFHLIPPSPAPFVWAKRIASTSNPDGERTLGLGIDAQANVFATGWFDGANDFGGVTLANRGGQGQDIFLATYNPGGALRWVMRAGGTSAERDAGLGMGMDAIGNAYVTGGFYDMAEFGSLNVTAPSGQESSFLAKYNPAGSPQWVRQADSPSANECKGEGLAVDAAGNSYAVGTFDGATVAFGSTTLANRGEFNTYFVKYDSSGTPQWAKNFSSTSRAFSSAVAVDANGFVFVAGHFVSKVSIDTTDLTAANTNGWNGFVAKFSGAGVLQWARSITGTNGVVTSGICADNLGHVYVSGGFGTVAGATATFGPSITLTSLGGGRSGTSRSQGMGDAFLAQYDDVTGAAQWARPAGGTGMDVLAGVSVGPQGGVYVTGAFENGGTMDRYPVPVSNGWYAVVAKYDAAGAAEWVEYASATGMTLPMRVVVDAGGDCYVTGWYQGIAIFGTNVLQSAGLYNQFLAKLAEPANPLQFAQAPVVANGWFQTLMIGPPSASVILQVSFNLTDWTAIATNTLPAGGLPLRWPIGTNRQQFFRARSAP